MTGDKDAPGAKPKIDVSQVKGMPQGCSVQFVRGHWYVVKRSYALNKESGKYVESRTTLGQIVDNVFYSKADYRLKFQRGMTKRKEPKVSELVGDGLPLKILQELSPIQINFLSNQFTTGTAGAVPIYYHLALQSHLFEDLAAAFGGADVAKKLLSIAIFFIVSGDNSSTHYKDFAATHYLPWQNPLSSQEISCFYKEIGALQRAVNTFFVLRARRLKGQEILISIDSTSIATAASRYSLAMTGKNKRDAFESQIGLAVVFNHNTHEPLFYRTIPGNLHDSKTMLELLTDLTHLDIHNECVASLDRGYCTLENVRLAKEMGIKTCMALTLTPKWSLEAVDKAVELMKALKSDAFIRQEAVKGATVAMTASNGAITEELWVHVFYSERNAYYAKNAFLSELRAFEELWASKQGRVKALRRSSLMDFFNETADGKLKRNRKAVDEALRYAGFFGTVTTYECTAQECYDTYDLRSDLERVFRSGKQDINLNVLRTHSDLTCSGKLFICFIALFLLERLKRELSLPRYKELKRTRHIQLHPRQYDIDDVNNGCKSVRYHRRPLSGDVLYLSPTKEQMILAEAAGCEGIYTSPPEF